MVLYHEGAARKSVNNRLLRFLRKCNGGTTKIVVKLLYHAVKRESHYLPQTMFTPRADQQTASCWQHDVAGGSQSERDKS